MENDHAGTRHLQNSWKAASDASCSPDSDELEGNLLGGFFALGNLLLPFSRPVGFILDWIFSVSTEKPIKKKSDRNPKPKTNSVPFGMHSTLPMAKV